MDPGALLALVLLFSWCLLLLGVAAAVALWTLRKRRARDLAQGTPRGAAPLPAAASLRPRDPGPPAPTSPISETASELASLPLEPPELSTWRQRVREAKTSALGPSGRAGADAAAEILEQTQPAGAALSAARAGDRAKVERCLPGLSPEEAEGVLQTLRDTLRRWNALLEGSPGARADAGSVAAGVSPTSVAERAAWESDLERVGLYAPLLGYPHAEEVLEIARRNAAAFEEAKRRRINEANAREKVRAALTPLADEGYFAFELLTTEEAGIIDQLVVGRTSVTLVVVMAQEGLVWEDEGTGRLLWGRQSRTDPATGRTRWWGEPFEEDPHQVINAMREDAQRRIFGGPGPVWGHLCFTEAELGEREDGADPAGAVSVWDLAERIPRGPAPVEGQEYFDPDEVAELARKVRDAYGREPWLKPEEVHWTAE